MTWRPDYDNIPTEPPTTQTQTVIAGDRPGDQYNNDPKSIQRSLELLTRAGWKTVKQRRDGVYLLQRPGTPDRNHNATLGAPESGTGLHCFTNNDPTFKQGHHSHFEILTRLAHGGDYTAAARALTNTDDNTPHITLPTGVDPQTGEIVDDDLPAPVDLHELMAGEPPETEWIVEPLLPARRLTGLVASRGVGKSLLILDVLARRAAGLPTLDQPPSPPIHVIYIDYEMGEDDLYGRLLDFGWTPDHPHFQTLTQHLHYFQLPDMPPLDTPQGGKTLEQLTTRYEASLVVIDTLSRVIGSGGENDAEPYQALYRHSEIRLKRLGCAIARLDHLGKDTTRGSRGSSAKEDALDVIWQMEQRGTGSDLVLTRTKGRQRGIPDQLIVTRTETEERIYHAAQPRAVDSWIIQAADALDRIGLDPNATYDEHLEALRRLDLSKHKRHMADLVRYRRSRPQVTLIRGEQ